MYNKYFNWSKNKISIKEEYFEEVLKKVDKFNQLIGKGKLIEFKEDNPREYLKMLYSDDDLLTYHNKL